MVSNEELSLHTHTLSLSHIPSKTSSSQRTCKEGLRPSTRPGSRHLETFHPQPSRSTLVPEKKRNPESQLRDNMQEANRTKVRPNNSFYLGFSTNIVFRCQFGRDFCGITHGGERISPEIWALSYSNQKRGFLRHAMCEKSYLGQCQTF